MQHEIKQEKTCVWIVGISGIVSKCGNNLVQYKKSCDKTIGVARPDNCYSCGKRIIVVNAKP